MSGRLLRWTEAFVVGALVAAPLAPRSAEAQWWPFKRSRPQPAQPTVPAAPPTTPAEAASEAARAAQAADRDRYVREARARELTRDSTAQNAQDRLAAWSLVRAIDPADAEALQASERARADLERARAREQTARSQVADSTQRVQIRAQLRTAQTAMQGGDLRTADATIAEVLATNPDDPQARSLQSAVASARRKSELRRLYLLIGGGLLVGGGGIGYLAWRAAKGARDRRAARIASRRAHVQVIDGVGRGRFVPIGEKVFRIGAVGSDAPEERNDLVLSDTTRAISRHHCTILVRDGDYYLVDTSRNGTWLNGEALTSGQQRRLFDGDEVVVADAARLKFLVT